MKKLKGPREKEALAQLRILNSTISSCVSEIKDINANVTNAPIQAEMQL